ncbi:hypothetical protein V5O48_006540 [Marasmius crinis-equi]|uniref:RING-type domain-containing protein n=1 Tax=Marasmius crinis-equi TaxID=585013 RepID=A0ABR3FJ62_9AGAR
MFIYHLSSACDVCLQPYRDDDPVAKQPHVIPCCHIFCRGCLQRILDSTADSQGRGRCPLCRHPFVDAGIKKLHVDAPAVSPEEYANGLLKLVLESWDTEEDAVRPLIADIDAWLGGKDENEFLSLRKARQALEQRNEMQIQISENKLIIRTAKKRIKVLESSRMEEVDVSLAKEESVQDLQAQLERSQAEVHSLREYIAHLEHEGRRSGHRDKGKGRADLSLETSFEVSRQRNPLPRPPQSISSFTLPVVEDSEADMAFAVEESMRYQRRQHEQGSVPVAGPSRTHAIGTSHTLANGHALSHSPGATSRAHSNNDSDVYPSRSHPARKVPSNVPRSSNSRHDHPPSPSPPRQMMIHPGPPDMDRMALEGPRAPALSNDDLDALRRSVADMNLQHSETPHRKSQSQRRHKQKEDERGRKGWAREAGRQEQIRGVTGLGLINENDEDVQIRGREPHPSVAPQMFEFPGARVVSATASASRTTIPAPRHGDHSIDSRIRQVVIDSYAPVHQPIPDSDGQSLLSNSTTGTWHSDQVGNPNRRRSMTSDILNSLTTFPSPDRRSSISSISSVSSVSLQNAFLPAVPPSTSSQTSNPSRSSYPAFPGVRATGSLAGSVSTSVGFLPVETPRPNNSSAARPATVQSAQPSGERARPRPSRHLTQPVSLETRFQDPSRGGVTPTAPLTAHSARTPTQNQYTSQFHDAPVVDEPQTLTNSYDDDFGNALGLDLSRDLGTASRQSSARANPQLVAPTPRASHHHFLRSFSDSL